MDHTRSRTTLETAEDPETGETFVTVELSEGDRAALVVGRVRFLVEARGPGLAKATHRHRRGLRRAG